MKIRAATTYGKLITCQVPGKGILWVTTILHSYYSLLVMNKEIKFKEGS